MLNYGDQILIDPSQPIKLRSMSAAREGEYCEVKS